MQTYNYKRIFHPKLGRFVYKHKGSGLIVDNIFKPMKKLLSTATKAVLKPLAKKALKSGIESAGDKIGKKAVDFAGKKVSERAGHLIMKDLQSLGKKVQPKPKEDHTAMLNRFISGIPKTPKPEKEDYNIVLNRLISGSGMKNRRKK